MRNGLIVTGLSVFVCGSSFGEDAIDPVGLYHNIFGGPVNGVEWYQVLALPEEHRYTFADIYGQGFDGTITPSGEVILDMEVGGGSFTTPDEFTLLTSNGFVEHTEDLVRAPMTTGQFPLELESPAPANSMLSGTYNLVMEQFNPRTGTSVGIFPTATTLDVTASGTTLSFSDPWQTYQGVFETPVLVAYRVIVPAAWAAERFETFEGSTYSVPHNLLGRLDVHDINNFTALMLRQTPPNPGTENVGFIRYTASRVDPFAPGDLNGDRLVDSDDLVAMADQLGLDDSQDGFNIAADLDGDGDIDSDDVTILADLILGAGCAGDCDLNGEVDFNDLVAMLFEFGESDGSACDADASGTVDFNDLVSALFLFGAC